MLGAVTCLYLVTPLAGRDPLQYQVAGVILVIGLVLWAVTYAINARLGIRPTRFADPENFDTRGPVG
ncbi:hypothetical protein GCM10025875_03270 [Litorihabitans aurantiacus]|uniref:Uncharacterized protein n=1 Tax=Litorihabitans aurantiacus TaxID=1930061 RepID=A0AA37URR3_9MICO|nr:hypothetical protein GCM10025875_03270 [Litorihabitans aurantiacus]